MTQDPPPRSDGLCARHGCPQPLPQIARREQDPFCSSDCCRHYHNIDFPQDPGTFGKGKKKAAA